MHTFQQLAITGYRDEAVPHTFFRQEKATDHAALILPGIGYTCQMPLLYYPTQELLVQGADVLRVEYGQRPYFQDLSDREMVNCITADAKAASQVLLQQGLYRRITLIGKSIGTAAMAYLLNEVNLPPLVRAIWLTPPLRRKELRAMIQQARPVSLFVIGTADSHYHKQGLTEVQNATLGDTLVIENANHSLEIPHDVLQSVKIMEQVIQSLQAFLR